MSNKLLTQEFQEPLDGATSATIEIDGGVGNLSIDGLANEARVLARGTLEYFQKQGPPERWMQREHERACLRLRARGAGRPWFRVPWLACTGGTEWNVHLSPSVCSDISAHSAGGNVKLDLAASAVSRVSVRSGGGSVEVRLPDDATDLPVAVETGAGNVTVQLGVRTRGKSTLTASSGAGNVVVRIPPGLPARVRATSGLGKVVVDSAFGPAGAHTYESPGYETAVDRLDITLRSGAGNVSVSIEPAPALVEAA